MFDTQAFRKSVLNQALKGKLTQQLPEDDNVSDLLQSIAEEKQRLYKVGKFKRQLTNITNDEIPFKIPNNWKWVRLNNIINVNIGKTPARKNEEYWNGNIPWITVKDMNNGLLNSSNEKITSKAAKEKFNNNIAPKGTMLMSFKLSIGKTCILDFPAYYNEAIVSFNFYKYENILKPYLFRSIKYLTQFAHSKSAVKGNTLNKTSLNNMLIPIPPLAEQKRIVNNINQCFKLADLIDQEQKLTKDFDDDMYKSLLQSAMQGKLTQQLPEDGDATDLLYSISKNKQRLYKAGKIKKQKQLAAITDDEIPFKIPDNWKWVRLSQIGYIISGGTPRKSSDKYWNSNDIPWLTPKFLGINQKHKFLNNSDQYISYKGLKGSSAQLIPKGSIVYSSRAPIGHINIVNFNYTTNQGAKSVMPFKVNNVFLYYALKQQTNIIKQHASGTTFKEISKSGLSKSLIPLPPLKEQKRIIKKLDSLLSKIDKIE